LIIDYFDLRFFTTFRMTAVLNRFLGFASFDKLRINLDDGSVNSLLVAAAFRHPLRSLHSLSGCHPPGSAF